MGILVPAYFGVSGGLWNELNFAAARVPLVAIMNPNNGPGATQSQNYATAVNNLRAAGGRVIGYVYTSYGARDTNTVKADIDRYFSFYAIDGIFLDEMTNDGITTHLDYYASLYRYIQQKGTNVMVVGNPGINTLEVYLTRPTADVLVTFEADVGYPSLVVDGWTKNHLARQFSHLPYNTASAATMTNYVNLAASRNAGWIYVTDDALPNPWNTLPAYWTNEVNYISLRNLSAPATQLSIRSVSNHVPSLQITGAPGTYELQATSNLASWFSLGTVNTATNQANVRDTSATNASGRAYRTRQ